MSTTRPPPSGTMKVTERIGTGGPGRGRTSGPMVGQKAIRFGPSATRVLARMRPERVKLFGVVALSIGSVALFTVGPRMLGRATDLIFAGLFGRQLPVGVTLEQAVEAMRATGATRVADMVAAMDNVVPGQGVEFGAVGQLLLLVLALYIVASLLGVGCRDTWSTMWSRAPCIACEPRSRRRSTTSRWATSTDSHGVSCSAA